MTAPPPIVTVSEVEDFISDIGLRDIDEDIIEETREVALARLEDACGVAFVPQTKTEQVTGSNGFGLLDMPRVIEVVTIDGTADGSGPYPEGRIPLDDGVHTVVYEHGWQTPPLPIKRAVLLLIRHYLTTDPTDFDERATSKATEMASWSLVTPGVRGAIFPIPEVNQIVHDYTYVTPVV